MTRMFKIQLPDGSVKEMPEGSTPADVAAAIESQTGIRVDRHDVHMDEPIRSVGVHEVRVHLFAEVDPVISVEVVASPE